MNYSSSMPVKQWPPIGAVVAAFSIALSSCVACVGTAKGRHELVDAQPPDARVGEHERDAEIPTKDLTLKGTLKIPAGHGGEKFPAVLFGPGSGPQSRDEVLSGQLNMKFGCDVHVFLDLANGLSVRGYASLRFDARSCGPFNGCAQNGYPAPSGLDTVSTELDDLRAAADWLRSQPDIDPARVFYVGHSEGASLAPKLLEERAGWRAAVMLAAEYHPIDQIVAIQLAESEMLLSQVGAPEAQVDTELSQLRKAVADLAMVRAGTFKGGEILGAAASYWKSWMDLTDGAPGLVASAPQPVLVMSGDYDRNVPPSELAEWRRLFSEDDDFRNHTARLVPCVTHALNCISQPDIEKIRAPDIGCAVDDRVIQGVTDFLDAVR